MNDKELNDEELGEPEYEFKGLQFAYQDLTRTDVEHWVKRDRMTLEQRRLQIDRLRREAEATAAHAKALEAEAQGAA